MKPVILIALLASTFAISGVALAAQQEAGPTVSAPGFVRLDGEFRTATGEPRTGPVTLVISLYGAPDDPQALWSETQQGTLTAAGGYTVFAGASQPDGLPRELFASGAARWIGVAIQGEAEQPRVRILSVPYALSAGNAETLGGSKVTDFVMAENLAESVKAALKSDATGQGGEGSDVSIFGTSGRIPKFDATGLAANIVDSVMFESSSNIGIGTTSPTQKLHISSATAYDGIKLDGSNRPTLTFTASGVLKALYGVSTANNSFANGDASGDLVHRVENANILFSADSGTTANLYLKNGGNVGVGTTTPNTRLHVFSNVAYDGIKLDGSSRPTLAFAVSGVLKALYGVSTAANSFVSGDASGDLAHRVDGGNILFSTNSGASAQMYLKNGGNVGIGTTSPTAKLHVAGDAYVSSNMTVDGNIGAKYQDVAEWVETEVPLEAGTVVIVDPVSTNRVQQSVKAYDTRVAGAVSHMPGLILGEKGDNKEMVAQSGRVRIKVDATFGAIKPGDLLVTSPTPGHAMLSKPIKIGKQMMHRPGTLVGKALEGLPSGKGEILVLLTLQ